MSWKILRILTTNACNYKCPYCHNEGQDKGKNIIELSFDDFKLIIEAALKSGIDEIRFSGGEPLTNLTTLDMIKWIDCNTDVELGVATNGSLLTDSIIEILKETRILLTIHLPSVNPTTYFRLTGGDIKKLFYNISLLDKYKIKYSFNYVYHEETYKELYNVIDYTINKRKQLKVLPFISPNYTGNVERIKNDIEQILSHYEYKFEDDYISGLTWWYINNGGVIKLVNSPCYNYDIEKCKHYSEIRLLPSLDFQRCIFDKNVHVNKNCVYEQLNELFNTFINCPLVNH